MPWYRSLSGTKMAGGTRPVPPEYPPCRAGRYRAPCGTTPFPPGQITYALWQCRHAAVRPAHQTRYSAGCAPSSRWGLGESAPRWQRHRTKRTVHDACGRTLPQSGHPHGQLRPGFRGPWAAMTVMPSSALQRSRKQSSAIESAPPEQATMTRSPNRNKPCWRQ